MICLVPNCPWETCQSHPVATQSNKNQGTEIKPAEIKPVHATALCTIPDQPALEQSLSEHPTGLNQPTDNNPEPLQNCQFYRFRDKGEKLKLIVGSDTRTMTTMIVCPSVLRNLSKEWASLVDQAVKTTWNKGLPRLKHSRQIVLPDYDPAMMAQIMKIAHNKFTNFIPVLDFSQTLKISLICCRFQMNHLIMPFLKHRAFHHKAEILRPGYEQWLFVAYQFGIEDDYLKLSKHLAVNCRVDQKGELFNLAGDATLEGHFPGDAIGKSTHSHRFPKSELRRKAPRAGYRTIASSPLALPLFPSLRPPNTTPTILFRVPQPITHTI